MTTISDNFAAKIVLTPMAPGRDAEFEEMLDEFRAAGEAHVYEGNFAVAWQGYGPFCDLISKMKPGGYPKSEIVPMDAYFIETGGKILGARSLFGTGSQHHSNSTAGTLVTRCGPPTEIAEWRQQLSGSRFKSWARSVFRGLWLRAAPPTLHRPG